MDNQTKKLTDGQTEKTHHKLKAYEYFYCTKKILKLFFQAYK